MWTSRTRRCGVPRILVCLFLAALFVAPTNVAAEEWSWTSQLIDSEGTDSWLVVDHDGNLHVSYRHPAGGQLKYGFYPAGGSRWFTITIDQALGTFLTRISLDQDGNPYVCYTPRVLKVAHFDGRRWTTQRIDTGAEVVNYYCSVLVGPDAKPQLSWFVESGLYLRYASLKDGVWVVRNIDTHDSPGKLNAMALDAQGLPHVSYIGLLGTKLKYAHFDGQIWIVSILDSPEMDPTGGDRGMGNSIAMDRQGNPLISYFNTESLKFAHLIDGKWKLETIDRFPTVTPWAWRQFRSTLVLDRDGYPHIGYQCPLGLKHAWWDGQRWRTQLILAPAQTTFDGALGIDRENNLYFTYTDPTDGSLRLATGRVAKRSTSADSLEKEDARH